MVTILSFPRSGNHFVRYIIEFLTGKATIGAAGFTTISGQDTPICLRSGPEFLKHVDIHDRISTKTHFVHSLPENVSGLVLLIRHPIESIISHRFHNISMTSGFSQKFSKGIVQTLEKDSLNFFENLEYYNNFNGPKTIVLYEDLIGDNYQKCINSLSEIFIFDETRLSHMLDDFEKYRMDSMKSPHRKPISSTKKNKKNFYENFLKSSSIENYNLYIQTISKSLNHDLIKELYG